MKISNINICVDRDSCIACGICVDRCIMDNLRLSVAPCRQACPLGLNCQGYVRLVALDEGERAAEELRKYTPFGSILGRVCNQPCEAACERNTAVGDGAVHIRAIKRYLADRYPATVQQVLPQAPSSGKKVAIVGSGPAGLSAAYELAMQGHAVSLYEATAKAGGMLRHGVPSYRLPESVLDDTLASLAELGCSVIPNQRLGANLHLASLRQQYDAVLVAVGLWGALRPAIPGADLPGVHDALNLLQEAKQGHFAPKVRSATVIGGGSTAMDAALVLKKSGVASVTILCLESERDMPVTEVDRVEAKEEGVTILSRLAVEGIRSEGQGLVLDVRRCLSVFDATGAFAPELDAEMSKHLTTDMVVFAIGQKMAEDLAAFPLSSCRLVDAPRPTGQVPGMEDVFVAGDCARGASSVVGAMADGKEVAACMHRYLTGNLPLHIDARAEAGLVYEYESLPQRANGVARGPLERLPVRARTMQVEVELALSPERAKAEAQRCMACGRAYEANKTCWYCLPCEIDCPQKALSVKMPYLVR